MSNLICLFIMLTVFSLLSWYYFNILVYHRQMTSMTSGLSEDKIHLIFSIACSRADYHSFS